MIVISFGTVRAHRYSGSAGFKTFQRETFIGPFDDNFTAIVGPNGLGKTVIADAARFALGANFSSIRVRAAKDVINHRLAQAEGDLAQCCTELGFAARISTPSNADSETRYIRIRRRVVASGHSTYYAACTDVLPGPSTCLRDTLPARSYVSLLSCPLRSGVDFVGVGHACKTKTLG